jgi:hypothetical protein
MPAISSAPAAAMIAIRIVSEPELDPPPGFSTGSR